MYEDHSFGGDYNNQYGYIGDPFAQNNEADENYITNIRYTFVLIWTLFIYTFSIKYFLQYTSQYSNLHVNTRGNVRPPTVLLQRRP